MRDWKLALEASQAGAASFECVAEDAIKEIELLREVLKTICTVNTACDGDYESASIMTCDLAHKALGYDFEVVPPPDSAR